MTVAMCHIRDKHTYLIRGFLVTTETIFSYSPKLVAMYLVMVITRCFPDICAEDSVVSRCSFFSHCYQNFFITVPSYTSLNTC